VPSNTASRVTPAAWTTENTVPRTESEALGVDTSKGEFKLNHTLPSVSIQSPTCRLVFSSISTYCPAPSSKLVQDDAPVDTASPSDKARPRNAAMSVPSATAVTSPSKSSTAAARVVLTTGEGEGETEGEDEGEGEDEPGLREDDGEVPPQAARLSANTRERERVNGVSYKTTILSDDLMKAV
jgi:hypothetical protein